jgi:hypothetical protein
VTLHLDRVIALRGRRSVGRTSALARAVLAMLVAAGCGSPAAVIRLEVVYEEGWALDALEVSSGPTLSERSEAVHELVIRAPPRWVDEPVALLVWGLRGGARYAAGRVQVTAHADREERATVRLTLLPCGDWCTPSARQCGAGSVVRCEQRDEDVCLEWGSPEACPTDAPECSLGECRRNCFDECAPGDRECAGPRTFRICAQVDADPCFDWQPTIECGVGETCSAGTCREGCEGECTAGELDCRAGGVVECGDLDFDGCPEWGPVEPCPSGESCEGGSCVANELCAPECSASECDEETFRSCGDYDFDLCLELSAGVSCVPTNPCREGRCTDAGCESATSVCMDAPAS